MATPELTSSNSHPRSLVLALLAVIWLVIASLPSRAVAQTTPAETAPPPASPATPRMVGGHVGLAVPLLDFHSRGKGARTPSDQFTIAVPIGVTVHLSPTWVFDFETVVGNAVKPAGFSNLTVDPGVVYLGYPVALGLRLKFDIGAPLNVGIIPLVHKGIADVGDANWFIEGAFPITITHTAALLQPGGATNELSLAIVFHTGLAF